MYYLLINHKFQNEGWSGGRSTCGICGEIRFFHRHNSGWNQELHFQTGTSFLHRFTFSYAAIALLKMIFLQVVFYKRINTVFFVDAIPKSPSGKILRKDLRAQLAAPAPAVLSKWCNINEFYDTMFSLLYFTMFPTTFNNTQATAIIESLHPCLTCFLVPSFVTAVYNLRVWFFLNRYLLCKFPSFNHFHPLQYQNSF